MKAIRVSTRPYVGEIPVNWVDAKLKYLLRAPVTDGPHETPVFIDEGFPFLSVDGIQDGSLVLEGCRYVDRRSFDEYRKKAAPEVGDLLMGKAASTGKIARVKEPIEFAIWSPLALIKLDQRKVDSRFLEYVLKTPALQQQIDDLCNANTQKNIGMGDIPKLSFALPTPQEQACIANFLDDKTARIDALIAEKERLAEAVVELFKARLGTAVVEGIDKKMRLTSAARNGFDKVREDWALVPLKHLATFGGGMTPSKDNEDFWVGEIPWVSPKDMKRFVLPDSQDHISEAALKATSLKLHPVDSVLVVVRGMILAHTFPVAMNAVPVTVNQDMKVLRPRALVSAKYLAWMLRGLQPLMLSLTEESAHGTKALRTDQWANQHVPVPSLEEQRLLVTSFELWEAETTALSTHLAEHLDRLREYRSSLISAAVTGQLDISSFEEAA